ncbi:MAG: DUF3883 domain-containing protein [Thermoguttaceae bacterium]|jgi:hypothetical protein
MKDKSHHKRLETEAIVLGYIMSRLDKQYLEIQGLSSWKKAFERAGKMLCVQPASLKNLRDEFDPFHGNPRKGWHKRPLRPNRQRVMGDLCEVSDEALLEMASRIIRRDEESLIEAIDALATITKPIHNVAERLLTGRRAEDFFLEHCESLIGIARTNILDLRQSALGYDFGVKTNSDQAIEVKGLKTVYGAIQFTDREWSEANYRRDNYWLVIVGNLAKKPMARVWCDPQSVLSVKCLYQTTVTATWRSNVSVIV